MTPKLTRTLWLTSSLFVAALLALTLQQHVAAAGDDDPPDRVARLSYLRGAVSFQPAGESDWVSAVLNRPMTTADRLWTDDDGRAELQLGSATVHVAARTGMSFLNLDDRTTQIELSEGTINVRVARLGRDESFEIDTPNEAFSILRPGQYHIEASEDGNSSIVTVRDGAGEATGGGRTFRVGSGESARFTGTASLRASVARAGGYDEFDRWSQTRDRRYADSRSVRYVSPDLVGYEDLDDYGAWYSDPEYGYMWVPVVASGWAPYHDGHWVWISPWGWTWVDDAPWGYAPFHYGRWVNVRNRWGWVPGPVAVRPVYAPALVVFVGGPKFSASVTVGGGYRGNVGWFPLGPREVYVPAYRTSREYVNRVNVSNTTVTNITITNVYNNSNNTNIRYANRNVRGGVTAVPRSTFESAQPVGRAAIPVNQREIVSAPVARRADVAPTRNSVLGPSAQRGARAPHPSEQVVNRQVVAKATPPPPPVPFATQQQRLAAQPGQPLARTEIEGLRRSQPADSRRSVAPANAPANEAPPARPGRQARPDVSTPPDRAARQDRPSPPDRQAQPDRPTQADRTVQPDRSTQPHQQARRDRPAQADRPIESNRGRSGDRPPSNPPAPNADRYQRPSADRNPPRARDQAPARSDGKRPQKGQPRAGDNGKNDKNHKDDKKK